MINTQARSAVTQDDPSLQHYINKDYNWWGENKLPENATNFQNNFTTNNYYMTILKTNQIKPAYIYSMIKYTYYMVLNTTLKADNVSYLPYFLTTITDINGNKHEIDARFQKEFNVKALKTGNVNANSLKHDQLNTVNFKIIKIPTKITAKDFEGKVGEKIKITAKLVDKDNKPLVGKKVIFNIEGKEKTAITDENGIGTIKYYCEKEGKVNFTVKFLGDEAYEPSQNNATITITKKPTTNNKTKNNPVKNPIIGKATMKSTGIAIILILLSSLGIIIRKK